MNGIFQNKMPEKEPVWYFNKTENTWLNDGILHAWFMSNKDNIPYALVETPTGFKFLSYHAVKPRKDVMTDES